MNSLKISLKWKPALKPKQAILSRKMNNLIEKMRSHRMYKLLIILNDNPARFERKQSQRSDRSLIFVSLSYFFENRHIAEAIHFDINQRKVLFVKLKLFFSLI